MATPYDTAPSTALWRTAVAELQPGEISFEVGAKFRFGLTDRFAAAGSCFAQHFVRELSARGGNILFTEQRHPLIPQNSKHGFGIFSARYGNIYSTRQLVELFEQATGTRPVIHDYARRDDGRWVDLLRPRAVPEGFSSQDGARTDRHYHLQCVQRMLGEMTVFVYTLGLTEVWLHRQHGYAYPVVPGAIAGTFSDQEHMFVNLDYESCVSDLWRMLAIVREVNSGARILLTVSPVMLVATAESRHVLVSSIASKSILRAAADHIVRQAENVDYFPSYEMITGPQAKGQFWTPNLRDVTTDGVRFVMKKFFASRLPELLVTGENIPSQLGPAVHHSVSQSVEVALDAECEEQFLDPAKRSSGRDG